MPPGVTSIGHWVVEGRYIGRGFSYGGIVVQCAYLQRFMKERCIRCMESRARFALEMMDLREGGEAVLSSSTVEHRVSCFECSRVQMRCE